MSLLIFAMALIADPLRDPCRDDNGDDRCSAAKQAEMRALYRVPPIETYSNATVRRVFFVDGYGNDTVALEFVRAAEKDPVVRVHFPKVEGEAPGTPIEQVLTAQQWQQVIDASQYFDRQFAPKQTPEAKGNYEDEAVICLHSWVYWAESIDRGEKPRSTVNDACNDQPVEQFAWLAAKVALRAIPFCNALDLKLSRNEAAVLRSCEGLTGDRIAAAEVWNRAEGFRSFDDRDFDLERMASYPVELDYQGQQFKGQDAAKKWREAMSAKNRPRYFYDGVHGQDAQRVTVPGGFIIWGDGKIHQRAEVGMKWENEGDTFYLKSVKVGPYRPYSPPTE